MKKKLIILMLSFLLVGTFGCKDKEEPIIKDDVNAEETFIENLESASKSIVLKEELPEFVQAKIDLFETFDIPQQLRVFRGVWNRNVTYYLEYLNNCGTCEFYYASGEKVVLAADGSDANKFISESKNWELVYQIIPDYGCIGCGTKGGLSDIARLSVVDKYEFPDISHLNDWQREDIMPLRFKALQIPDNVLATISTVGLLETCLEFPYLLNIICSNDYQHGFEQGLLAVFNGFRELMDRTDLVDALIIKYNQLQFDVQNVGGLSLLEIGMFAYRHFVLEMIIAQDAVIKNMNGEQARTLFLLASERMEIKISYPDIFSGIHIVPPALLYAKKLKNDNLVRADMRGTLDNFILAPTFVDKTTWQYLNEQINNNFK